MSRKYTPMRITTRFLTTGLASLAVASTITLAGPAFADEPTPEQARPCGQPASPALYLTVVREGVPVQVPAVTHDEWRWERTVTTVENEYSRVVTAAYTETDWTRQLPSTTEFQWVRTVIDQPAVPEVAASDEVGHWADVVGTPTGSRVEYEYRQQTTDMLRWAPDGWNGEQGDVDHGKGWTKTGRARQWVIDQAATPGSPAVPEKSHLEYTWAATSPGADWNGPVDSRTTGGGTETATTKDGQSPAGAGWVQVGTPRTVPAVVDTVWALDAPEGYTGTGRSRVRDVTVEQTDGTSATGPDGEGWSPIADSRVVVIDHEAYTETIGGSTEQVLVRAAQDATAPCTEVEAAQAPTAAAPGAPATGHATVAGVTESSHAGHAGHAVAASADAADGATAMVLPEAGSPVSPLLLATGLGALLTGGVLGRSGRRRNS
jgi:hypothetical protein